MEQNYKLSFKSKDCINAIKEKVKHAKVSIDIEIFYFIEDKVGSDFLKLLLQKAKEGLKIRLLFDHVGAYYFTDSKTLDILKRHRIKVLFFNSIMPFSRNRKTLWFFRDHRRSVIIDDEYVFTGSVCIGEPTTDWVELGIFVKDTFLAQRAKTVFNQTWNKVYHPTFNIGSVSKKDLESVSDFNYITQSPLQFKRHIYKYYLKAIKKSKDHICLISPYFIPTGRLVRRLVAASERGVKVDIIIPQKTDWAIVDVARNTYLHHLMKHGINIYFHKNMVHSKFATFDAKEAFLGTMNLDNLSLRYNYECGVKILNTDCVAELKTHIRNDLLPHSVKLDIESWNNRGIFLKFLEKCVWIVRRFL